MSTSIDDNVEEIELQSCSSTKSYIKTKLKITDNKVSSPPSSSPAHSSHSAKNDVHNLFLAKTTKPQPLPRRRRRLSSRSTSESHNSEPSYNLREKPSDDITTESLSDARSHREKFRERFESVKKQAGKSASKAQTFKSRAERTRSLKKCIKLMRKENVEVDEELSNYQRNKESNGEGGGGDAISKIDAYNFFCGQNEGFGEENGETEDGVINKSTEVLITVQNEEEHELDIHFLPADNLDFNRTISENDLFWQPSRRRLDIKEKIESEEPRFLAEEGFYIEKKSKTSWSLLNILEQRLLGVNDKKWFNCEGELDTLPDPCAKTSRRPQFFSTKNDVLDTTYVGAQMNKPAENMFVPYKNILNVSILALKFKHHPLFSSEHVLEQRLITLCDKYKQKTNGNRLERIKKRLDALRNAKNSIQMMLNDNTEISLKKLNSYTSDIIKLREIYFNECRSNRKVLKGILQTWQVIKKIRQNNNYSSTRIKLNITKEKCSYEEENNIWENEIKQSCAEVISELEYEFEKKQGEYKKKLEEWKAGNAETPGENPKKPRKPSKDIDYDLIMEETVCRFKECFKSPGEPILRFNLSYDNEPEGKNDNPKEKLRKNAVATTKVCLRVLCKKIEVCKSKILSLNEEFVCFFDESFSIQLTTIPESLVVEIHEQPSTLMKRKLGEIKIRIPGVASVQDKIQEEHFQKNEIVHYKHEGVGSGISVKNIYPDFSNNEDEPDVCYTSGIVTYKIGWDTKQRDAENVKESTKCDVAKSMLNENGTIDVKKLMSWANENNPDPQDPKNSVLYEYINNYEEDFEDILNTTKSYFRCNPDATPFEFCQSQDIENNIRFKILELRNKNEPEFVGMVVPNRVKEISPAILVEYQQRCQEENHNSNDEDTVVSETYDKDEIASRRSHGRKYLKQVYTKVFQQCRNTENNLVYEDVVDEKLIPYIENFARNLITNILSWFQFQPTINIILSKSMKTSQKPTDLHGKVNISIKVKSALNVPLRSNNGNPNVEKNENGNDATVQPTVAATYQKSNAQTLIAEGVNPVWNEELILPLESSNTDYLSPNSLTGSIVIQLFDEITMKSRDGEVPKKNWLGSVEIPVSTIAYTTKMEGLFKIQKPINLFGYDQNTNKPTTRLKTEQTGIDATYLSLKIALKPNIPKLTQNMDELETTELPYTKDHIIKWNEAFNNEYPNRKFSALAINKNGKTTCVTRFIRPLEPPQLNADRFNVTGEQCARYVSLIPFTDTNKFYENVWLNTEELFNLMIGSVIDHAVALTCYLTALDAEVWLMLGYGLPHGATAYVLVREYAREQPIPLHVIYDVVTATKYDIMDTLCPLQKIFGVINEHNVWANIQRTDQIQLTHFDFTRRSDWLPLFTNQHTAPTNSIQKKLIYSITPQIKQLEMKIDQKIRKKITKLRKYERTIWNHQLSEAFKQVITRCESDCMHGSLSYELCPVIRNFSSTHFLNGFLVNVPYTNIAAIISDVVATGIHLHDALHTEFACSVQIYTYANHVLSVWICLATATQR